MLFLLVAQQLVPAVLTMVTFSVRKNNTSSSSFTLIFLIRMVIIIFVQMVVVVILLLLLRVLARLPIAINDQNMMML